MKETKQSIAEWNAATFPEATLQSQWLKMLEELQEYDKILFNPEEMIKEYADIYIVSAVLEERFGCPYGWMILRQIDYVDNMDLFQKMIGEAVDEKMKINRARKWHFVNGVYRHEDEQ